jgi:hypothetical protein
MRVIEVLLLECNAGTHAGAEWCRAPTSWALIIGSFVVPGFRASGRFTLGLIRGARVRGLETRGIRLLFARHSEPGEHEWFASSAAFPQEQPSHLMSHAECGLFRMRPHCRV